MKLLRMLGLMALVLGFSACQTTAQKKPKAGPKFNITITTTNLNAAQFQVDVVAVNPSTRAQLEGVNVNDYFSGQDRLRESVKTVETVIFPTRKEIMVHVDETLRFPRYSHLAIIANIPVDLPGSGAKDPRKLFLPLDGSKWPKGALAITVTITPVGIRTDPGWLE